MPRDYAAEGRLHEILAGHPDLLKTATADFIDELRAGMFKIDEAEAHITKCRDTRPHRFLPKPGSDDDLERRAYLFGNVTAQGQYLTKHGMEAAKQAAARYQNTFASGKPGVEPPLSDAEKANSNGKPRGTDNPWSPHVNNIDAKTGRYSAKALTRQAEIVRSLGLAKAQSIASVWGVTVGAVRPIVK